jgi:hypothetical protein
LIGSGRQLETRELRQTVEEASPIIHIPFNTIFKPEDAPVWHPTSAPPQISLPKTGNVQSKDFSPSKTIRIPRLNRASVIDREVKMLPDPQLLHIQSIQSAVILPFKMPEKLANKKYLDLT